MKKPKKERTNITRRDILKMGAGATGAAAVFGPTMLTSRKASAYQDPLPQDTDTGGGGSQPVAEPVLCGTTPPVSPATTTSFGRNEISIHLHNGDIHPLR